VNHVPVLLNEVIQYLALQPNEDAIDATVNGGGHAEAILENIAPHGYLLGIDRDPSILDETKSRLSRFGDRAIVACGNFANIAVIAERAGVLHPSAILFDLGTSSYHLASANRGFSFQGEAPLDMRYNPDDTTCTAEAIINHAAPSELERIFEEYGELARARRLVEQIVAERKTRPIRTTRELVSIIERVLPRGRIHPATKIFQALRIAVNQELESIEAGLRSAFEILAPNGRMVVISFHSLEDRIVKRFFASLGEAAMILTKKPHVPTTPEIRANPHSRSAKLRAVKKIA